MTGMAARFVLPLIVLAAVSSCDRSKKELAETGGGPAAVPAAPASSVPGKWVQTVVETPEGGVRMGNPDAHAKLIEYGSYTCPHCALFSQEAMPELRGYVATGKLSYEFRPFVRDAFDLTAALLARCGGPTTFFGLSDQIFSSQREWMDNAQNITPADQKKIEALPVARQFSALSRGMGLNALVGQRGLPQAKADQCLGDRTQQDRMLAIRSEGEQKYKIEGTPTFILGGQNIGSFEWVGLKPRLVAAMGG